MTAKTEQSDTPMLTREQIENIRKLAESYNFGGVPVPQLCDMALRLLALLKEREEAERDAARYRWLRGKNHVAYGRQNLMLGNFDADLDAAIDSALTRKDDNG